MLSQFIDCLLASEKGLGVHSEKEITEMQMKNVWSKIKQQQQKTCIKKLLEKIKLFLIFISLCVCERERERERAHK